MKNIFIIGNWKSNKTVAGGIDWLIKFNQLLDKGKEANFANLKIVVCVPFTHLYPLNQFLTKISKKELGLAPRGIRLKLRLGGQDVSPFPDGAYTGEVSARMLAGLADYCLVGHSERRQYFKESNQLIANKVKELKEVNIEPIVCVQNEKTPIPPGVRLVAYEPVSAIGSGKATDPKYAEKIARKIKNKYNHTLVIYGGSVTKENISLFISQPNISGVLPGGASLDPDSFYQLIIHAH